MSVQSKLDDQAKAVWREVAGARAGLTLGELRERLGTLLDEEPLRERVDKLLMGRYLELDDHRYLLTEDCRVPAGESVPAWLDEAGDGPAMPSSTPLPEVPVFLKRRPLRASLVREAFLSLINEGEVLPSMMLVARAPVVGLTDTQVRTAIRNMRTAGYLASVGTDPVTYSLTTEGVAFRREKKLPVFPPLGQTPSADAKPDNGVTTSPQTDGVDIDRIHTTAVASQQADGEFECSLNSRGALFIQSGPYQVDLPLVHVKQLVRFLSGVDLSRVTVQKGRAV